MKKLLLFVLTLFVFGRIYGQSVSPEVIGSAGSHFTSPNAQLSWTLGEPVIDTYKGFNSTWLTQGFHQTGLIVTAVEVPVGPLVVRVFPNPTMSQLTIDWATSASGSFCMELTDAHGRLLQRKTFVEAGESCTLDLSEYRPGLYLLQVFGTDNRSNQTFKIVKQN